MAVALLVHCDENVVVQVLFDDDFQYIQDMIDSVDIAESVVLPPFLEALALAAQVHSVPSLIHLNDVMVRPGTIINNTTTFF